MTNPNPSSHKPKSYKHSHLEIVNVKWDTTYNPNILRLWPKPYLIGVVDTKSKRWVVNNLLTREHIEGEAKTTARAKALIVSHLVAMAKSVC
jgi:hypothetical protein